MTLDKGVAVLRRREFFPVNAWLGATKVGTNILQSFNSSTDSFAEVNSSGVGALKLAATAEGASGLIKLPEFDPKWPLNFHAVYTSGHNGAAANVTFTWTMTYLDLGTLGTTALAAPATALDTTIAAHAFAGTPYGLNVTAAGAIKANKFTKKQAQGTRTAADGVSSADLFPTYLGIKLLLSAVGAGVTIGSDFAFLFGIQVSYVPQYTAGSGPLRDLTSAEAAR